MSLQLTGLSKRRDGAWVLRDVAFDLEAGRTLSILGAARSGKSTLLRLVAGVEKPTPAAANVGIPASAKLITSHSEPRSLWPFGNRHRVIENVSKWAMRSLDSDRGLYLFDDVFAHLDPVSRQEVLSSVRHKVAERGLMAIYATADFETAAIFGDKVAVLADGTIHQTGSPEEVYQHPETVAAARMTGRCNVFFARRLTSTRSDIPEFQTIEGGHRLFTERADIRKLGPINKDVPLSIRPEDISMSFDASFPEDNLLKALLREVIYLGPLTLVRLDAGGLMLEGIVFRLVGLEVGQECMVALPPDRIKVLAG